MKKFLFLVGVAFVVVAILGLLGVIKFGSVAAFFLIYPMVAEGMTEAGLNPHLSYAVAVMTAVAVWLSVFNLLFTWKGGKRQVGLVAVAVVLVMQALFMYLVTTEMKESPFVAVLVFLAVLLGVIFILLKGRFSNSGQSNSLAKDRRYY